MVVKILACVLVSVALGACSSDGAKTTARKPSASEVVVPPAVIITGGETDESAYVGLAGAQAYVAGSFYADVLPGCMVVVSSDFSCPLAILPFLGQEANELTVEAIMSRVVVSHQWMGARFHELLLNLPDDALLLFKSVTAVVISDDVRPSYFSNLTGAIYLDPMLLWQTREEKSLFLQFSADPQSKVSVDSLRFRSWSRYVKGGESVAVDRSVLGDRERDLQEVLLPAAALLFHELAHANDFFPAARLADADVSLSVYEFAGLQKGYRASDLLVNYAALESGFLDHLAQVMYLHDGVFSAQELASTAEDLASEFDPQAANDDYAFVHQFEDAAMLFEEVMMAYHFQVDRDVAYLSVPAVQAEASCDDYKVVWGMRNRLNREDIKARAQIVVEAILPKPDWPAYFMTLDAPQNLAIGAGWCESARLSPKSLVQVP